MGGGETKPGTNYVVSNWRKQKTNAEISVSRFEKAVCSNHGVNLQNSNNSQCTTPYEYIGIFENCEFFILSQFNQMLRIWIWFLIIASALPKRLAARAWCVLNSSSLRNPPTSLQGRRQWFRFTRHHWWYHSQSINGEINDLPPSVTIIWRKSQKRCRMLSFDPQTFNAPSPRWNSNRIMLSYCLAFLYMWMAISGSLTFRYNRSASLYFPASYGCGDGNSTGLMRVNIYKRTQACHGLLLILNILINKLIAISNLRTNRGWGWGGSWAQN